MTSITRTTVSTQELEDLLAWIDTGFDLSWWLENDDHHQAMPETWKLAQRVSKFMTQCPQPDKA